MIVTTTPLPGAGAPNVAEPLTWRSLPRLAALTVIPGAGATLTVAVAVGVLAAGTGIGWAGGLFRGADGAAAPSGAANAVATTPVRRGDLVETRAVDGELGYGKPSTVAARTAGTLTQVADEGTVVSRGQTLYAVDGRPVTLLIGVVPMYRPLRTGVSGVDVRQLEQNLHDLGYGGFAVDDDYTTGTVQQITGRPPRPVAEFLHEYRAEFA